MKNLNPSEVMAASMLGVLVIGVLGIGFLVYKGVSVMTTTAATSTSSGGGLWVSIGEAAGSVVDKLVNAYGGKK